MNVYPFIEAEQAGQRNVGKACALLEVSRRVEGSNPFSRSKAHR